MCLFQMNKQNNKFELFAWFIISITISHIAQSTYDQGINHWIAARLWFFARDIGFYIGDFTCLIVSIVYLGRIKPWKERYQSEKWIFLIIVVSVISTMIFLSNVTFGG
jgi:hypothetical protein